MGIKIKLNRDEEGIGVDYFIVDTEKETPRIVRGHEIISIEAEELALAIDKALEENLKDVFR